MPENINLKLLQIQEAINQLYQLNDLKYIKKNNKRKAFQLMLEFTV
jgi:hypothetical protein